jgi:hypothetical protein
MRSPVHSPKANSTLMGKKEEEEEEKNTIG